MKKEICSLGNQYKSPKLFDDAHEHDISEYLHELPNLQFIEIKSKTGKFLYLLPIAIIKPIDTEHLQNRLEDQNDINNYRPIGRFIDSIRNDSIQEDYRNISIREKLKDTENILNALKKLRKARYGFLPVVTNRNELIGIALNGGLKKK